MTTSRDTIFGYYKVDTTDGPGFICIRLDRPPKGQDGIYKAAYSFCSPLDQFNRKRARQITAGRINSSTKHVSFTSEEKNAAALFKTALHKMSEVTSQLSEPPRWLSKAIKIERFVRPKYQHKAA